MGEGGVGADAGGYEEGRVASNFSWAKLFPHRSLNESIFRRMKKRFRPPDYRRKLPHYLPNDAPYFVTTRLAGSVSPPEIAKLKALRGTVEEGRFFLAYDEALDAVHDGIDYLRRPPVRELVRAKLMELEERQLILLHAFSLMPNHIHLVAEVTTNEMPLFDIMKLLKGPTARYGNILLHRTGQHFWQWENYDHVVRLGSLERIIRYVLMNPVKAHLVENWWEWPGNYLSPRYDRQLLVRPTKIGRYTIFLFLLLSTPNCGGTETGRAHPDRMGLLDEFTGIL